MKKRVISIVSSSVCHCTCCLRVVLLGPVELRDRDLPATREQLKGLLHQPGRIFLRLIFHCFIQVNFSYVLFTWFLSYNLEITFTKGCFNKIHLLHFLDNFLKYKHFSENFMGLYSSGRTTMLSLPVYL